jgi:hypothetical protein
MEKGCFVRCMVISVLNKHQISHGNRVVLRQLRQSLAVDSLLYGPLIDEGGIDGVNASERLTEHGEENFALGFAHPIFFAALSACS